MFSNAIRIFTINGFDIKLDPSWLLIAALITWSLSGFFPTVLPDQTSQTYLAMAVIAMLCFFVSLLLHELAHSFVARHYGVQIKGITLFLFGGVAELESEPQSAGVEFWIAIAGPLMSLVLALFFNVLSMGADAVFSVPAVTEVLSYLGMINLVLALFNLVPAFPLDGGRVLRAYIWHRTGSVLKATQAATTSGTIVGYGLMGIGVVALFQGAVIAGLWQILIGSFVLVAARGSYRDQLGRSKHANEPVSAVMKANPIAVSPELALSDYVDRILFGQGRSFVPVVEDGVLLGHMDREILSGIDQDNWATTQVGDIFEGLDPGMMIPPDMLISDLMAMIGQTGRRKFLVTRGHELVGVITLADLTGYLMKPDETGRSRADAH